MLRSIVTSFVLLVFICFLTSCDQSSETILKNAAPGSLPLSSNGISTLLMHSSSERDFGNYLTEVYTYYHANKALPPLRVNFKKQTLDINAVADSAQPSEFTVRGPNSAQKYLDTIAFTPSEHDSTSKKITLLAHKVSGLSDELKALIVKRLEPYLRIIESSHAHDTFIAGCAAYNKMCLRAKLSPNFLTPFLAAPPEQRIVLLTEALESPSRPLVDSDQEATSCIIFMNAVAKFSHIKNIFNASKAQGMFEVIDTLAITNHKLYKTPTDYLDANARFLLLPSIVLDVLKEGGVISEEEAALYKKTFEDCLRKIYAHATRSFNAIHIRKSAMLKCGAKTMPFALIPIKHYTSASLQKKLNSTLSQWIDTFFIPQCIKLYPGQSDSITFCFDALVASLTLPLSHSQLLPEITPLDP